MLRIIAKQVVAIGITPRIDDVRHDRIQELLEGTHPMSSQKKKYDTGTKRKTVLDPSPAGPEEIPEEPEDRSSHHNVGSTYYRGSNSSGGQADDETGPGNTPKSDKEQTFTSHDTVDLAFKNDFDTSNRWSPLNYETNARDRQSTNHLRLLHQRPKNRVPVRYPVDELSRAAGTWSHIYV